MFCRYMEKLLNESGFNSGQKVLWENVVTCNIMPSCKTVTTTQLTPPGQLRRCSISLASQYYINDFQSLPATQVSAFWFADYAVDVKYMKHYDMFTHTLWTNDWIVSVSAVWHIRDYTNYMVHKLHDKWRHLMPQL